MANKKLTVNLTGGRHCFRTKAEGDDPAKLALHTIMDAGGQLREDSVVIKGESFQCGQDEFEALVDTHGPIRFEIVVPDVPKVKQEAAAPTSAKSGERPPPA